MPVTARTLSTDYIPETRASTATDFKLPPIAITGSLSATDRDNYFGENARNTFFDYYR